MPGMDNDKLAHQTAEQWELIRKSQQDIAELRALLIGVDGSNGIRGMLRELSAKVTTIDATVAAHSAQLSGCVDEVDMQSQVYEIRELIQTQEKKREEARDMQQHRAVEMRIAIAGIFLSSLIGAVSVMMQIFT